jgi:hypothetical protein
MSGESEMVLEVQGVMRLPEDEGTALRLREAGFLDGQEVSFQIELAGLHLRTRKPQGLQGEVRDIVADLHGVDGRIGRLLSRIPESPDAVLEGQEPYDIEAEVRGALECARGENLQPAIRTLERAAFVTPEQLKEEWEQVRRRSD